MYKQEVFNKSIVLVGPAGVGKSLISQSIHQIKQKMPIISTDILRHCPKDVNVIIERKKHILKEINNCEKQLCKEENPQIVKQLNDNLEKLRNDDYICDRQIEMRTLLPNVVNYEELGFDGELSQRIRDNFGPIAWHMYQKQFENQLLLSIIDNLEEPVILDLGGGMTISLDKDYEILEHQFRNNPNLTKYNFDKIFNKEYMGYDIIRNCLAPFDKVVELVLPENYKQTKRRASDDKLNEYFISTGQYHEQAKISVHTDGLIVGEGNNQHVDEQVLKTITNEILDITLVM